MDIDTIDPGLDFVEAIQEAVGSCDALLAVIGRQWLTSADVSGHRRLDNPEDFVRLEITTALERRIRVIPVLIGGVSMPRSTELPDVLQPLARRQALVVGDHFHPDVDRLIAALETVLSPILQAPPRTGIAERPATQDTAVEPVLTNSSPDPGAQQEFDKVVRVVEQTLESGAAAAIQPPNPASPKEDKPFGTAPPSLRGGGSNTLCQRGRSARGTPPYNQQHP